MEEAFVDQIVHICSILEKHSVQYMLVGGTAVAFHGYYRETRMIDGSISEKHDFDFWYNPSYDNYFRLLDALEELGIEVAEFRNERSPDPKRSYFKHTFQFFSIDFLPEMAGLGRFFNAYQVAEKSVIGGVTIPVISKADLIANKTKLGRAKDRDDLEHLDGG